MSAQTVRETTLANGLRIVTAPMQGVETATVAVHVGVGSRHEREDQHGLSHFIEHMAFKGTARRNALAIAEAIESAGGDLNAATATEHTVYHARVLAQDVGLALDILGDILTHSVFDAQEMEREKSVILQEIAAVGDDPDDLVFEMFDAAAFAGQPIGRSILGAPKRVKGFDETAIRAYLAAHYGANNLIVSAAGAVEHAAIVEQASSLFENLPQNAPVSVAPARYTGGEARKKRGEQTNFVIGFEGFDHTHEASYAAHVFASAVGGGMASRLFQDVREKRGLAYSIYSFNWSFADTGLFGVSAATAPRDAGEAIRVTLDALAAATQDLSEAEMARAKAQMKVSLLAAFESSPARAEQIARQTAVFGRVLTRKEIVDKIDALTLERTRAAGAALLKSAPTLAAVGPTTKVPDVSDIAARIGAAGDR
ncbi:MAG: insulinase family protein [Hyphomicrobiales bacterium]|nr:insulinase family protein [Hyphomicrobiales bacterium]